MKPWWMQDLDASCFHYEPNLSDPPSLAMTAAAWSTEPCSVSGDGLDLTWTGSMSTEMGEDGERWSFEDLQISDGANTLSLDGSTVMGAGTDGYLQSDLTFDLDSTSTESPVFDTIGSWVPLQGHTWSETAGRATLDWQSPDTTYSNSFDTLWEEAEPGEILGRTCGVYTEAWPQAQLAITGDVLNEVVWTAEADCPDQYVDGVFMGEWCY